MEFYDKLKFCSRFREKTLNQIGPLKIYSKSDVTCVKFLYRFGWQYRWVQLDTSGQRCVVNFTHITTFVSRMEASEFRYTRSMAIMNT